MRPVGTDEANPDQMDVILRLRNLSEFQSIWQSYVGDHWNPWVEIERPRRRSIEFYNKIYQIYQRLIALGDDTPIELVFGVGVARWMIHRGRNTSYWCLNAITLQTAHSTGPLANSRPAENPSVCCPCSGEGSRQRLTAFVSKADRRLRQRKGSAGRVWRQRLRKPSTCQVDADPCPIAGEGSHVVAEPQLERLLVAHCGAFHAKARDFGCRQSRSQQRVEACAQ